MGGNAFAKHNPELPTPRLDPRQYRLIRDALVTTLYEDFRRVAVPIEGPDKSSYGDIDIVVTGPRFTTSSDFDSQAPDGNYASLADVNKKLFSLVVDNLEKRLQPVARKGSSFALSSVNVLGDGGLRGDEPYFVQVDITVVPAHRFHWHYFMHCHGDTWNMLSPSLRRVGLVLTDVGLCACHPLIAPHDRKRSRVMLTNDPNTVLDFLGLDPAVFWGKDARLCRADSSVPELSGELPANLTLPGQNVATKAQDFTLPSRSFASEAEHFAFLATSRFFNKRAYLSADLRSSERRRMERRPAYGRFVRDFVPTVQRQGDRADTYDDTLVEALDRFQKREEYVERERQWKEEQELLSQKRQAREIGRHTIQQEAEYVNAWLNHCG